MSGSPRRGGGWGWLVLIAIPPIIVIAGLVTLFVWQGAKGGVRGKWQKAPPRSTVTNAAPVRP